MKMLDYVDTKKTAIAVLKDWHYQQRKIDSAHDDIESLDAMVTRITPSYSEAGGSSSGNHMEEKLATTLHKKEAILNGYHEAQEYVKEFNAAWEQLTEEEQYILRTRFIESGSNGIQNIMDRLFIGKTEAYRKCDAAVTKFAKYIFW